MKRGLTALIRPGLIDVERRLIRLEWAISRNRPAAWLGGLDGALRSPYGDPRLQRRLRDELAFWRRAAREGGLGGIHGPLHEVFGGWQRQRMAELADWLGLDGQQFDDWRRAVRAVEVGAGPHPFLLVGSWRSAVAVDPLADGYRAEGLLPELGPLVYLAAPAEEIPLPGGSADLVVTHNCLDHVDDPGAAAAEMRRLLAPGGLLWLIVDLRDTADEMHPHAFGIARIREMLRDAAFECVRDEQGAGGADPSARGVYRGLWRRA
ncbi:MAG: class I SAM-dependent methyltransferase [Phycisphaerales bacterium JB039]